MILMGFAYSASDSKRLKASYAPTMLALIDNGSISEYTQNFIVNSPDDIEYEFERYQKIHADAIFIGVGKIYDIRIITKEY